MVIISTNSSEQWNYTHFFSTEDKWALPEKKHSIQKFTPFSPKRRSLLSNSSPSTTWKNIKYHLKWRKFFFKMPYFCIKILQWLGTKVVRVIYNTVSWFDSINRYVLKVVHGDISWELLSMWQWCRGMVIGQGIKINGASLCVMLLNPKQISLQPSFSLFEIFLIFWKKKSSDGILMLETFVYHMYQWKLLFKLPLWLSIYYFCSGL